jgi:NADPH:quinone reductase-like Zn-dependent oxidoreductase
MRAITFHHYGAPADVLHHKDIDEPIPAENEVLVQVQATSVNAADWHIVRAVPAIARLQFGLRKPNFSVPGCDFAGHVVGTGKDVTTLRAGDEVYGCSFMRGFGAFAERVAVHEQLVARKPSNLTFEQAAAVPLAASTALQGLRDHGQVESGCKVLIVGASGGVGTFAVQIAKALGAEVTAVCSTRNVDLVHSLGADHVIDYTTTSITEGAEHYDLILELAGTTGANTYKRLLTSHGRLIQISGDSNNRWLGPMGRIMAGRLLSPFVSQTISSFTVNPNRSDLDVLTALIEDEKVDPVIDSVYSLADITDAVHHVEAGHTRGKVVVATDASTIQGEAQ